MPRARAGAAGSHGSALAPEKGKRGKGGRCEPGGGQGFGERGTPSTSKPCCSSAPVTEASGVILIVQNSLLKREKKIKKKKERKKRKIKKGKKRKGRKKKK